MNNSCPRGWERPGAHRRRRVPLGAGALALSLVLTAGSAFGEDEPLELRSVERLHVDAVYPAPDEDAITELLLRATTSSGEPVEHLRPVDLSIRDNGAEIDPDDVSVAPFGEADHGIAVALAIDTSRTMKGDPFDRALAATLAFVDELGPLDRMALVSFSTEARLIAPFGAEREKTRASIEQLTADDASLSTVLYDGVHTALGALREAPDLPRRAFVIVFSDGKDSGSVHTLAELIEGARGSEGSSRIPIFGIGYARFGGDGLETLEQLSRESAAEFFHATSTLQLASLFDVIRQQMIGSYLVRFPAEMDGEDHLVEVTIEGQSDSRTLRYPEPGARPWIWPLLLAAAFVVVGGTSRWFKLTGGSASLRFLSGARRGETVQIGRGGVRLGALTDNDVVIDSPPVSRHHARIDRNGGKTEIEDLGSRNGTFVNGARVRKAPLSNGDTIRLGDVDLEFRQ